jgi:arylsulfatase
VKDNRLHDVYHFVGVLEQRIDGTEDLPIGVNVILFIFRRRRTGRTGRRRRVPSPLHGDKGR